MATAHPDGHSGDAHEPAPDAKQARKRWKQERKFLREAHRPLDGWERYRALRDAVDHERRLVDLGDHKARFALVIMGALNAGLFIIGVRVGPAFPLALRPWLAGFLVVYVVVTLGFFFNAIEALRPRFGDILHDLVEVRSGPGPGEEGYEDQALGLLVPAEILRHELKDHQKAWSEVHVGQLHAELALMNHGAAHMLAAQYRHLSRLYLGLKVLTLLAAALLAGVAVFGLRAG